MKTIGLIQSQVAHREHFVLRINGSTFHLDRVTYDRAEKTIASTDHWDNIHYYVEKHLKKRVADVNAKIAKRDEKVPFCKLPLKTGEIVIERILAMEVAVLFFGLDGCARDSTAWDTITEAWQGFRPEELWWLYQRADNSPSWRAALPIALGRPAELAA